MGLGFRDLQAQAGLASRFQEALSPLIGVGLLITFFKILTKSNALKTGMLNVGNGKAHVNRYLGFSVV